jgi:hypothetical protein
LSVVDDAAPLNDAFPDSSEARLCLAWLRSVMSGDAGNTIHEKVARVPLMTETKLAALGALTEIGWDKKSLRDVMMAFHPDKWDLCQSDSWRAVAKYFHHRAHTARGMLDPDPHTGLVASNLFGFLVARGLRDYRRRQDSPRNQQLQWEQP